MPSKNGGSGECCPLCLLHVNSGRAQAPLLMSYTPNLRMERVNPDSESGSSRPWHGRPATEGLLNHTRKTGVPSRILTSNLTLRTRPLCALSYGDKIGARVR